jgi:hypothetical protein
MTRRQESTAVNRSPSGVFRMTAQRRNHQNRNQTMDLLLSNRGILLGLRTFHPAGVVVIRSAGDGILDDRLHGGGGLR